MKKKKPGPYTDITRNNHGGNAQSNAANVKLAPYKLSWREKVLGFMAQRDAQGLGTSARHFADEYGKEGGHIAGRFTELKRDGLIEPTGFVENDYMTLRLVDSPNVPLNPDKVKKAKVTGKGITGGILTEKQTGGWRVSQIHPKELKKLVGDTPVSGLKDKLMALGLTYSWVNLNL